MPTKTDAPKRWVLRETLASEKLKQPIYFMEMVAIGPRSTSSLAKAKRFENRQAAMMSPAYSHALSCYEAELEP
jgi:hypothetical protein